MPVGFPPETAFDFAESSGQGLEPRVQLGRGIRARQYSFNQKGNRRCSRSGAQCRIRSERNPARPLIHHKRIHPGHCTQFLQIPKGLMLPARNNCLHHIVAHAEHPLELVRR
jgi:hypothetical protein